MICAQSYHDVSFFHLLDFVSISAYFRLIFNETDPIPSPKQTKILFDRRLAKLNRWRLASGLSNKKVLVGEIGFQSKGKVFQTTNTTQPFPSTKWANGRLTNVTNFLNLFLCFLFYSGGNINYHRPWAWTAEGPHDTIVQVSFFILSIIPPWESHWIPNSVSFKLCLCRVVNMNVFLFLYRLQRVMYEAFLSSFLSKPWSLGVMIWHYELNVNAGLTYAKLGYTPQNKPAQWVMKRYFKSYCRENAYVQTNNNTRKPTA